MKAFISLLTLLAFLLSVGCATHRKSKTAERPSEVKPKKTRQAKSRDGTSVEDISDPLLRSMLKDMEALNLAITEANQVVSWCETNSSGGTVVESTTNQVTYTADQVTRIRDCASVFIVESQARKDELFALCGARIEQLSAENSVAPSYQNRRRYKPTQVFTPTYNVPTTSFQQPSVPWTATPTQSRSPYGTGNRYDPNSLANPYGAGNPYKPDGLMNPYSQYGSPYSNKSWSNPYATDAPKLYDQSGNYLGRFNINRFDPDSVSNPYGRYGSPYSPTSINNPYGAGNPFGGPVQVVPQK